VSDRLDALRRRIDAIDEQIVRLLNERSACALEIGAIKRARGLPVYQPAREQEVLAHVRAANGGPLDAAAITRLYERIIDEARRLERLAAAEPVGRATMDPNVAEEPGGDVRAGTAARSLDG
jgi:chorismate mutase